MEVRGFVQLLGDSAMVFILVPEFSEKKLIPNLALACFRKKKLLKTGQEPVFGVYIIMSIITSKVPQIAWSFRVILYDSEKEIYNHKNIYLQ